MSLNIKTPNGLQEIGKVTKEKVVSALGFEPADKKIESTIKDNTDKINTTEASLAAHEANTIFHVSSADRQKWDNKSDVESFYDLQDAPSIVETDTDEFVIADEAGNVAAKVDKDGLSTANINTMSVNLAGEDLGAKLASLEASVEASKLPSIVDDGSGRLEFTDEDGNVAARLDEKGFETATVIAKKALIDGVDIKDEVVKHVGDDTHLREGERERWDAKSDFNGDFDALSNSPFRNDYSGKLEFTDDDGNIIARLDENGFETTAIKATEISLETSAGAVSVKDKFDEFDSHIVDDTHLKPGEREKWDHKSDFNGDFDALSNSPIRQDGSDKLSVVDEDGHIVFEINSDGQGATNVYSLLVDGKQLEEIIAEVEPEVLTEEEIIALVAEGMAG